MKEDNFISDLNDYIWYEKSHDRIAELWNYTPSVFQINLEFVEKMQVLKDSMRAIEKKWGSHRVEKELILIKERGSSALKNK